MFVFIIGLNSLFHIYIFLWNMTCKKPILNKEILLLLLGIYCSRYVTFKLLSFGVDVLQQTDA